MMEHPDEVWIQLYINLSRYIDTRVCTQGGHSALVAQWVRSTARALEVKEDEISSIY